MRRRSTFASSIRLATGNSPALLEQSDMFAMLPSRCVPENLLDRLEVFEPPIPVKGFPLHLAWHRRRKHAHGLRHVAGLLATILK